MLHLLHVVWAAASGASQVLALVINPPLPTPRVNASARVDALSHCAGQERWSTQQAGGYTAQVCPTSEYHILRDCSHWITLDQPREACLIMRGFLAAHPLPPGSEAGKKQ